MEVHLKFKNGKPGHIFCEAIQFEIVRWRRNSVLCQLIGQFSFKCYGWSYAGIGAILVINHGSTVFLTIICVFFSFSFSIAPFVWKDLQRSLAITKILQCQAKNVEDKEPFFMKVYYYSCLTIKITFNSFLPQCVFKVWLVRLWNKSVRASPQLKCHVECQKF